MFQPCLTVTSGTGLYCASHSLLSSVSKRRFLFRELWLHEGLLLVGVFRVCMIFSLKSLRGEQPKGCSILDGCDTKRFREETESR